MSLFTLAFSYYNFWSSKRRNFPVCLKNATTHGPSLALVHSFYCASRSPYRAQNFWTALFCRHINSKTFFKLIRTSRQAPALERQAETVVGGCCIQGSVGQVRGPGSIGWTRTCSKEQNQTDLIVRMLVHYCFLLVQCHGLSTTVHTKLYNRVNWLYNLYANCYIS